MDEENERQENFEKLKKFFNSDMNIKKALIELAPTSKDEYDKESKIQYVDKLYKELKNIEYNLLDMCRSFGQNENMISNKISSIRNQLISFNYEDGDIKELYKQNFSDISEKVIETVKDAFIGYTIPRTQAINELALNSKTINELLHIVHSSVVNDEEIMKSMPIIDEKNNDFDMPITLYGEKTELAESIFEGFPKDLDVSWTDIVAMENRALMMVRDRGHALTIDIERTKDADIIRYFIPKICNLKMVQALPGIGKITSNGANGVFETKREEIVPKLFDFIGKVPTDFDMYLEDDDKKSFEMENSETIEQIEKNENQPEVLQQVGMFDAKDAKDIAMEKGENGTKISNIVNVQQKLKEAFLDLRGQTKDKGEQLDEQSTRD